MINVNKRKPTAVEPVSRPAQPVLLLVIPGGLGEAAALRALANAVKETYTTLSSNIELFSSHPGRSRWSDRAYRRGRLASYREACDLLVEDIGDQSDIYDQLAAREQFPCDPQRKSAPPRRPRLPEGGTAVPADVLDALYGKRDHFAAMAGSFDDQAQEWKDDGDLYQFHRGMYLAYATSCDQIEQVLARLAGLDTDGYAAFAAEHGTCREVYQ